MLPANPEDTPLKETPLEKQVWNNPDPRVKWALDILEPEGEKQSFILRMGPGLLGGFLGLGASRFYNMFHRLPKNSNIVGTAISTVFGAALLEWTRKKWHERSEKELMVTKHYIMLHPELFPEPEPIKYGDKRVFFGWSPDRRF